MVRRWLPTTSILVVVERIYRYQFKSHYLKNHRLFAAFFYLFLVSTWNFQCSKKKWAPYVNYFWSYWLRSMCLFKCMTGFLYENPLAVKVLTSLKNYWILQKSSFILVFSHSEPNLVRRTYFESDLRFWDCLLTRWLPTTSILVVVNRIYRYQFKANDLKDRRFWTAFFSYFWYLHEISNILSRDMSLISQVFLKLLTSKDVLI